MSKVQFNPYDLAQAIRNQPNPPQNPQQISKAIQALLPDGFQLTDPQLKNIERMVIGAGPDRSKMPESYRVDLAHSSVQRLLDETQLPRQDWMHVPDIASKDPVYNEFFSLEDVSGFETKRFDPNHKKRLEEGYYESYDEVVQSYLYSWLHALDFYNAEAAPPTHTHHLMAHHGIGYKDGVPVVPSPRNFIARRKLLWQRLGIPKDLQVPELILVQHPEHPTEIFEFEIGEPIPQHLFDRGFKVLQGVMPANLWSQYFPYFMPMSVDAIASHDGGHSQAYKVFPEVVPLLKNTVYGPEKMWTNRTIFISENLEVAGKNARTVLCKLGKDIAIDIESIFASSTHDQVQASLPSVEQLRARLQKLSPEEFEKLVQTLKEQWPMELIPFGGIPSDIFDSTEPGRFLRMIHPFWNQSYCAPKFESIDKVSHALRFAIVFSTLSPRDFISQGYVPEVDPKSPIYFACSQLVIEAGGVHETKIFNRDVFSMGLPSNKNDISQLVLSELKRKPKNSSIEPWEFELPDTQISMLKHVPLYHGSLETHCIFDLESEASLVRAVEQMIANCHHHKEPLVGALLARWIEKSCTIEGQKASTTTIDRILESKGLSRVLKTHEALALTDFAHPDVMKTILATLLQSIAGFENRKTMLPLLAAQQQLKSWDQKALRKDLDDAVSRLPILQTG